MNKQSFIKILLTMLISMTGLRVFGHDIKAPNADYVTIYYVWINNYTELAVSYGGQYADHYSNEYTDDVVIPESVEYDGINYPVTSIDYSAFSGCSGLTSVTIPESVTSIYSSAFRDCSNLASINIPNSVTYIGGGAFYGTAWYNNQPNGLVYAGNVAYKYKGTMPNKTELELKEGTLAIAEDAFSECGGLASINFPTSLKSIGAWAFSGCSSLTSITIPNSVTSIGEDAFCSCDLTSIKVESGNQYYDSRDDCNALIETSSNTLLGGCNSTTIPNSVTSIGNGAFAGCSKLTSINIPNSVTSIGYNAFAYCSGLNSVTIPNSVKSIGGAAFGNCNGLTSITIPQSVTSIGKYAFDCSGLTSFNVESGNQYYDSRDDCNALIETSSNTLLVGCKNTTIPNSVTSIGEDAFSVCTGLISITIPNSVTSIGECAFSGCCGLTSITIPKSVKSIGSGAFMGCSGLTSIKVENGNQYYDSRYDCNALIETSSNKLLVGCNNTTIPNRVTSIGSSAFSGCSGLTSISIPNSVTFIEDGAFDGCSGLISFKVESDNQYYDSRDDCNAIIETSSNTLIAGCKNTTIPFSVTSIGDSAFGNCSSLTSISIPNSVTSIGIAAFGGCGSLTSISIPNSVTSIGNFAFDGCSSLTSVSMPSSLFLIDNRAFMLCDKLRNVYCLAERLSYSLDYEGLYTHPEAFEFSNLEHVILHVPAASIDAYRSMKPWSQFGKIVDISIKYGDVNGDGIVNVADLVSLVNIIKAGATEADIPIADLNGDGEVNKDDVEEISKIIIAGGH